MPAWKVLLIMLFGLVCLALALATVVVPISMAPTEPRVLTGVGFFAATVVMGTLFTLFLRNADRTFKR